MGIVHDEPRLVLAAGTRQLRQRSEVAIHAEDAIGRATAKPAPLRRSECSATLRLKQRHVGVALEARARQAGAIDERRVVQPIQ